MQMVVCPVPFNSPPLPPPPQPNFQSAPVEMLSQECTTIVETLEREILLASCLVVCGQLGSDSNCLCLAPESLPWNVFQP